MSNQLSTTVVNSHVSRVLRGRTEILLLPKQACSHLHLYPIVCLAFVLLSTVDWEALESSSPGLQPDAKPSQLPVHLFVDLVERHKKTRCLATPGMNELVHYLVLQTQLLRKAIANSFDAFRKRLVCRYEHHFQFR